MPFIRLLFITALLMIALPAHAAWDANSWKRTAADAIGDEGATVSNVRNGTSAVIFASDEVGFAVADDDVSPALRMAGSNGHTICLTTDSDVVGNGGGALTVEVFWFGSYAETAINNFILLATLTSGAACVYDVPQGELLLRAGAAANTDGLVSIRANR